ncbi:Mitochondrial import inner membrane translocase subunit tim8 [Elasticomyces elasticus]|nr:Mitochondrial import inner membrane translocase subunit tim8 [Elasticomyces elasticus]
MAIKNRAATLWCMLLLLLVLFTTTTFSREVTQDISVLDFHNGLQAAANGTFKLPEQSFGLPNAVEKVGDPPATTTSVPDTPVPITPVPDTPAPAPLDPYTKAVNKGGEYLDNLRCDSAKQSPFLEFSALWDNGWSKQFKSTEPPTVPAFNEPPPWDVDHVFVALGLSTKRPDNPVVHYTHGRDAGETQLDYGEITKGKPYGPTKANYHNQFNPAGGFILCGWNYSPDYEIGKAAKKLPPVKLGPAPPMSRLSDVLWLQWKVAVEAKGGDLGNVKYFLRHQVMDKTSDAILNTIAAMPDEKVVAWPGNEYYFTDPEGSPKRQIAQALLGSPNGVAVAFFLMQHRVQIGGGVAKKKTLEKVRLFSTQDGESELRHLLFYVMDVVE